MALFKINRGSAKNLPATKTEGYMYITEDVGDIYIDLSTTKRIKLNAEASEKIRKITYDDDGQYLSEVSLSYDDLYGHINDADNPHHVTAQQIGAITASEMEEAINEVSTNLKSTIVSAQGLTAGTGFAYTLAYEGYELQDGNLVKFQLHLDSESNPTLNINNTGAKPIMLNPTTPFAVGNKANTWFIAVYSELYDIYLIQWANIHQHMADDIKYNNTNIDSALIDIESKLNVLTAKESGQTVSVALSTESIDNWIITKGYWNGKYISTGG